METGVKVVESAEEQINEMIQFLVAQREKISRIIYEIDFQESKLLSFSGEKDCVDIRSNLLRAINDTNVTIKNLNGLIPCGFNDE